jgi:glycosyltransferase involved in cell wall biosynthesis
MSRKKILLLSDDLRMSSGVGCVSKEFVLGTVGHYDWAQMGGAIKHPDQGKVFDMKDEIKDLYPEIENPYLMIYPTNGYGDQETVRALINREKPDAIMIYTDPRFWVWLYQMEHEIRSKIPIFYYNIWDDLPYPHWNEPYYESCDLIMNISKQTVNIVNNVRQKLPVNEWNNTYIPHGINQDVFKPLPIDDKGYKNFMKESKHPVEDYEFVVFYNARNIRRKLPGDVILAFSTFVDMIPEEKRDKCLLLMHTNPIDENGTNLMAVADAVANGKNVKFSDGKISPEQLNYLYNFADVTLLISSNEGFGLSTAESVMAGTPMIVNVTGGMQDQCGFRLDDKLLTAEDYTEIHSLHDAKKWKDNPRLTHGSWTKPIWPTNRSLQGSPPTPYIFDDRPSFEDVAEKLYEWYQTPKDEREKAALEGREWMMREDVCLSAKRMCNRFIEDMDTAFEKWTPRKQFKLYEA